MKFAKIRGYFLTGLAVLLPALVTLYMLFLLFSLVDNLLGSFITSVTGRTIPGLGLVVTIIIVFVAGFLATNIIFRGLLIKAERVLYSIPLLGYTYGTTKQIVRSFANQSRRDLPRLVLVQYPRIGIYSVAFVVGETKGEIQAKSDQKLLNLFLPTTPNPIMGYLLIVPKDQIIPLHMSAEDGFKLIISGGVCSPQKKDCYKIV